MKYVKILITRDECLMACASTWQLGVFPENELAKALKRAEKIALELDRQTPAMCRHEVKEIEMDVEWD